MRKKTLYSILQSKLSESKSNSYKILNNHCLILQAKMSPHNFTKNNNIVIIYYIIRGTPSPLREKGGGGGSLQGLDLKQTMPSRPLNPLGHATSLV